MPHIIGDIPKYLQGFREPYLLKRRNINTNSCQNGKHKTFSNRMIQNSTMDESPNSIIPHLIGINVYKSQSPLAKMAKPRISYKILKLSKLIT